jgi:dTDP-glucose 4,6-dehydratase
VVERAVRILITGNHGTLGWPLTALLREQGHTVWGCGRRHSADDNYVRADVAEWRQMFELMGKAQPHLVYHFAAEFGRVNGEEFREDLWRTNVLGTRNVLDLALSWSCPVVFASSSEIYGDGHLDEPLEEPLSDFTPKLTNEYAISKFTNELQIANHCRRTDHPVAVLRFFNVYGPGEDYTPYRSVVALFCYRALTGQKLTVYQDYHRAFQYVDDFIPALARIADARTGLPFPSWQQVGGAINVGGSDYRSVEELAKLVCLCVDRDYDSSVELVPKEAHNVLNKRPHQTRAIEHLLHDPTTKIEVGVPLTIGWMRDRYGL